MLNLEEVFGAEEPAVVRACFHQAGHVIAAMEVCHRLPSVALLGPDTDDSDHYCATAALSVSIRTVAELVERCRYHEQVAMVLLAGREAEALSGALMWHGPMREDYRRAEGYLAQVCASTDLLDASICRARSEAQALVARRSGLLVEVAQGLARRVILEPGDLQKIVMRQVG